MKKILTVLSGVGLLLFTMCGCYNGGTFVEKTYSSAEADITCIIIDVSDREIEVGPSEDDEVHINYWQSEKEYYNLTVSEGTLEMKLVLNKSWTDFFGTKPDISYRKIRIEIPQSILSGCTISTTNESIKVSCLSVKDSLNLACNGGDITFEKMSAEQSVKLTVKNGDISGILTGGWDDYSIECNIKKGESNLPERKPGGKKSLVVDCNNGDVNIQFVAEKMHL